MMRSLAAQRRVLKALEPQLKALKEQFEQAVANEQARLEAEGAAAAKADDLNVEDLTVDPSAKPSASAGGPDAKADAKPPASGRPAGAKPAGMGVTAEAAAKNDEELIAQTRALFENKGESQSARSIATASTKPTPDNDDDDLYDF